MAPGPVRVKLTNDTAPAPVPLRLLLDRVPERRDR